MGMVNRWVPGPLSGSDHRVSVVQVGVLVVVSVMLGVPVPVVQVIGVVVVQHRAMAAAGTVDVVVVGRIMRSVGSVIAHGKCALLSRK